MKPIWKGLKKLFFERPLMLAVLLGCAVLGVWFMMRRDYESIFRTMALPVCSVCGILGYLYYYGQQSESFTPAQTVLSEESDLTMRIVSTVAGASAGRQTWSGYDPGSIETFYVVFENHTGAAIETDTSYRLERSIRWKWYCVESAPAAETAWKALEIPEGRSGKLCIPAASMGFSLSPGYYRMVKSVKTRNGLRVIAAGFSVDEL